MKIVRSIRALQKELEVARRSGKKIHFVPTMGALHAGHIKLVTRARRPGSYRVVSIFVNPIQFGPKEDFDRYPRNLAVDAKKLRRAKVDLLFAPDTREMVAKNFSTFVDEPEISRLWCGACRPGHFHGVLTIVAKLFHLVRPDVAYFGQKDFQQWFLIQKMTRDLNFPCRIVRVPTVREKDGLALSSRNVYLSREERKKSRALVEGLRAAREVYRRGINSAASLKLVIQKVFKQFPGVRTEYIGIANHEDLQPVRRVRLGDVILLAARVGKTRLIDNWIVGEAI